MLSTFRDILAKNPLYPLTDRAISSLSHAEQVHVFGRRGVGVVQLREKQLTSQEFYFAAAEAMRAARSYGIKLIINDRLDIALAVEADGVHLGQDDLPAEAARHILGPHAIIGVSTHNIEQARIASQLPIDYIGVGPVFSTNTKATPSKTVGIEGLRRIRDAVGNLPLVAIGGITQSRFEEVLAAGASGLAVISDLWPPTSTA